MSQDPSNPFALPGMTAAFMNTPNNPLLTSMDMMRQAMGYGAKSGSSDTMVNPMAPEELERKIADLRVVENWLKLNLSMLGSTIQGMEVQLATVKTLQSFVAMGQSSQASSTADASPLEIALGLKPGPKKASTTPKPPAAARQADSEPSAPESGSPQQAAAQGWWNMLESQFAQIAAATANAAKMGSEAMQQTAAATNASDTPKKQAATKPRAAKKATKTTRAPNKES